MQGAIEEGIDPQRNQLRKILRDGQLIHPLTHPQVKEAAVETPQHFDLKAQRLLVQRVFSCL